VPEFTYRRGAVPPDALAALKREFLGSELVSLSTLGGPFEHSRGFDIIFKQGGLPKVAERFPSLGRLLGELLGEPAVAALASWWSRLNKRPLRIPNAWYLNLLVVGDKGAVGPHVDATLAKKIDAPGTTPEAVTVIYLHVPQRSGGELVLTRRGWLTRVVKPKPGALLPFRGDLVHEVRPVEGTPPGEARVSLVIEQYHLSPSALEKLKDFQLDSRAGFGAFLQHHAKRPGPGFVLK
jgi:hypothetical protein